MYSKKFIQTSLMRKANVPGGCLLPQWRKIVVPAIGAPYSLRSIELASRILSDSPESELHLVYVIDVPRALALHAALPTEESLAQNVLANGLEAARSWGAPATTEVLRGREATETLLKYTLQSEADMIVLGARPDELRGLPSDVARDRVERAECPVIVDYIAAETR